ncbi:MAG: hypothetical protein AB8G99_26670 [Planctomycetaceae bacterium]
MARLLRKPRSRYGSRQSESLEQRVLLTAPVATNFDAGSFNVGTKLQVDAADIVSDFGTDADGPLDATGLTFGTVVINGNTVSSLAGVGFAYLPGAGSAGGFTIDTRLASAFAGLGSGDTASVVVDFAVTDGVDSDTGEFQFEVLGENLGDINETFTFLGPTVEDQEVLAEADDDAAGVLVDFVVAVSGPADISEIVENGVELSTTFDGISVSVPADVTIAAAARSGSEGEAGANATARASNESIATAVSQLRSSATASASNASFSNTTAFDSSTGAASADGGSAASAVSRSSSLAAADAQNGSIATATAEGGSVASATGENAGNASANAINGSASTAEADDGSSATAFSRDAALSTATAENTGIANAVAIDGGAATATARDTSDATSVALDFASAVATAERTSSASAAAGHGIDNTIDEAASAEVTATDSSTAVLAIAGDSDGIVNAGDNSVAIGLGIEGVTVEVAAAGSSAARGIAADDSETQAVAANDSAADARANTAVATGFDDPGSTSDKLTDAISVITDDVTVLKAQLADLAMSLITDSMPSGSSSEPRVETFLNDRLERDAENPIAGASQATAAAVTESLALSTASQLSDASSLAENASAAESVSDDDSSATTTADNTSVATATAVVDSVSVATADNDSQSSATSAEDSAANANSLNLGIADAVAVDGSAAAANASNGGDATSFAEDSSAAEATADTEGSATASADISSNAISTAVGRSTSVATSRNSGQATAVSDNQNVAVAFAQTNEVVHVNASETGDVALIEMSISETDDSETELNLDATSIIVPVAGADVPIAVDAEELDGKTIDQIIISVPAGSVLSAGTPNGDGTEWTFSGPPPANLILSPPSELTDYFVVTRAISDDQLAEASFRVSVDFTCDSVMPGSGITQVGDMLVVAGTDGKDLLKVQEKNGEFRIKLNKEKSTLSMDGITSVFMCGFNGNDRLIRPAKSTLPGVVAVGNGKDKLTGRNADETLLGGGGYDKITAKGGDDFIRGGDGRDKINAGKGNDIALGGADVDVVSGSSGRDILFGGEDKDQVKGGSGEDIMIGGSTTLTDEQLQSILADWTAGGTYEDRVTTVRSSLSVTDIMDTAGGEKLAGGGDTDWFFANETDSLAGFKDFEELDLL